MYKLWKESEKGRRMRKYLKCSDLVFITYNLTHWNHPLTLQIYKAPGDLLEPCNIPTIRLTSLVKIEKTLNQ